MLNHKKKQIELQDDLDNISVVAENLGVSISENHAEIDLKDYQSKNLCDDLAPTAAAEESKNPESEKEKHLAQFKKLTKAIVEFFQRKALGVPFQTLVVGDSKEETGMNHNHSINLSNTPTALNVGGIKSPNDHPLALSKAESQALTASDNSAPVTPTVLSSKATSTDIFEGNRDTSILQVDSKNTADENSKSTPERPESDIPEYDSKVETGQPHNKGLPTQLTLTPKTLHEAIKKAAEEYTTFNNQHRSFFSRLYSKHGSRGIAHVEALKTASSESDLDTTAKALQTFFAPRADGTRPGTHDHSFVSFLLNELKPYDLLSPRHYYANPKQKNGLHHSV